MKPIQSALLRAFHGVALEGGFTRAARLLGLSQPTLSQQVKLLEETYGVRLFDRSGRSVTPTALGQDLFAITRRLFMAEQEAEELLTGARGLTSGRLSVGADGPYHAIPLLKQFRERHDGVEEALSVGNSTTILNRLLASTLDVVVVSELPGDPKLFAVPLRRDPIVAMLPSSHRLARHRSLSLKELSGETIVLREVGSLTRRVVERCVAASDFTFSRVMEIETREAVREAVAGGLGIGFVSAPENIPDQRIKLLPLRDVRMEIDEFVVCLRERRRLAIVRAFMQVAAEAAKTLRQ